MQMLRLRTVPCAFNMLAVAAFASPSATDLLTSHSAHAVEINHVSHRQMPLANSSLAWIPSDNRRTRTDGARRQPLEKAGEFEYPAGIASSKEHGQETEIVDSMSWSRRMVCGVLGNGSILAAEKPKPNPKPPSKPGPHGFMGSPAPAERQHHCL